MRFFTSLLSLAAITAALPSLAQVTPATPPQFETLFVGQIVLGDVETINNTTFGTRVIGPIVGGNLTDTSGNLVATLLAGSDTGVISNSGSFFPEVVLPLRWAVDNKFAYISGVGVGELLVSDMTYLHLETDSETYSALNSRFLLGNITFGSTGSNPTLTIFGLKLQ